MGRRLLAVVALVGALPVPGVVRADVWTAVAARPVSLVESGLTAPETPVGVRLRLELSGDRVGGEGMLACGKAQLTWVLSPAQGLFEGLFSEMPPASADAAARRLGFAHLPVPTLRVTCANAGYDLHLPGPDEAWLALDGRLLRLERERDAPSPVGTVTDALVRHFSGKASFDAHTLARWEIALTPEFRSALDDYLSQPSPEDEPPEINGDPFADTQELPHGYTLEPGELQGDTAHVDAVFVSGDRRRRVRFHLRAMTGGWAIDDIEYEDGSRLGKLIEP